MPPPPPQSQTRSYGLALVTIPVRYTSKSSINCVRVGLIKWLACPPLMWVGRRFEPRPGHTKDYHKDITNCLPAWHANALEFDSAARLSERAGSVWNCLFGTCT